MVLLFKANIVTKATSRIGTIWMLELEITNKKIKRKRIFMKFQIFKKKIHRTFTYSASKGVLYTTDIFSFKKK